MKTFSKKFKVTSKELSEVDKSFYKDIPANLYSIIDTFGGWSFNQGLYRVHSFRSSVQWSILLAEYFKGYQRGIYPFGFDWAGRQFCIDESDSNVYMFDPSTLEDLKMKQNIMGFHDDDLVSDILEEDLFKSGLSVCEVESILYSECLGLNTPLFLGGEDRVENYKRQDIEVYWHFQNQLYNQVKDLPEGTKVKNVEFNPLPR